MPETRTELKTPEALSLQARLEQLEAAIVEGHAILNRISGRDAAEGQAGADGAMACVDRCQGSMAELNQRLSGVADKTGVL